MTKEEEKRKKAIGIGGGVTLGMAGYEGALNEFRDQAENASVPRSRSINDLRKKIKPGDVVFHRTPNSESFRNSLGITNNDILSTIKGDPFGHASIYTGHGRIIESGGGDKHTVGSSDLMRRANLRKPNFRHMQEDLKIYRPKVSPEKVKDAIAYAVNSKGREYASDTDLLKHAANHLLNPTGGPNVACKTGKKGITCTELVAEAYPDILKKRYASPADMRASKDLELVARYGNRIPMSLREKILSRAVYPTIKNLKYGVGAGALAYGGLSLLDRLKGEDNARRT